MSSVNLHDANVALDFLFSHKREFIRDFLQGHGLPRSGTKSELRQRVEEGLEYGTISPASVIRYLDAIEGWGNQHIYLYHSSASAEWITENAVLRKLRAAEVEHLLNQHQALILPDEPTPAAIWWSPQKLQLLYVEKREWLERVPEQDREESSDVVMQAFRRQTRRGLIGLDWDLSTGHAALMIQRLPHGTNYEAIRLRYEAKLGEIISMEAFERLGLGDAISRIEVSGEVRRRQIKFETDSGSSANLVSSGTSEDAFDDPDLQEAGESLRAHGVGALGNYYWLPEGPLLKELHTTLHARDGRIAIYRECYEEEVRHVLSRVRHYR
jgi:hypothetical protein